MKFIPLLLFILCSCYVEEQYDQIDQISKLIKENGNKIIFLDKKELHFSDDISQFKVNDNFINQISIYSNTIFDSGFLNMQYAYGDLTRINDSTLLLACQQSKNIGDFNEGNIILSKSCDNGISWSKPVKLLTNTFNMINVSMPSLINLGNGKLMVFFSVKYGNDRIDIRFKNSSDNGVTWSRDKLIGNFEIGYQILNNGRVIKFNNRIIVPISIPNNENSTYINTSDLAVFYYYSDDLGNSWKKSSSYYINSTSLMEPGITQLSDNELLMNIRTDNSYIIFARSFDNGLNWIGERTNIASLSSPQKILKINNILFMLYNNSFTGYGRNIMTLFASEDKGFTWNKIKIIDSSSDNLIQLSYPSMYYDEYTNEIIIIYHKLKDNKSALKISKIKLNEIIF